MDVGFRPMAVEDLPMLHGWLQDPETAHWYRFDDLTAEDGPERLMQRTRMPG